MLNYQRLYNRVMMVGIVGNKLWEYGTTGPEGASVSVEMPREGHLSGDFWRAQQCFCRYRFWLEFLNLRMGDYILHPGLVDHVDTPTLYDFVMEVQYLSQNHHKKKPCSNNHSSLGPVRETAWQTICSARCINVRN